MGERFLRADEVINGSGSALAGFNRRTAGWSWADSFQYENERYDQAMQAGWRLADKMISEGKQFYTHNFHHSHDDCSGFAFWYGGTMVCNTCGAANLQREWWNIKVQQDGNAWCCIGTGFENLQESDNCAFGDTRDEAIKNYGDLMKRDEALKEIKHGD